MFLLHEPNLIDIVREYADFLPIPIHVNRAPDRANLGTPPWEEPDAEAACRAYVRRRYGEAEPLWVSTLTDGVIDLGHDTLTVPLRGFLFVPSQSVVSIKEYGTVAVYIRGMAICDEDKGLLPAWARFVRAVIDCPALQPTASREAVHQDDAFAATRRVIDDQLSRGLRDLAARQPAVWRRIVYGHSDVIMGWAAKDDEFFRMVADVVPLRTSRGRLALPDYLKESGNVVYYTTHELGSLQEKVLAEGRDVPAIDASWFAVPAFLQRYAGLHSGVTLVRLDDDLERLLRPAPPGELTELLRLCEELGFAVRAASFRPTCLPAVMTYPADAEALRDAASALEEGVIPDGFSGLLCGYVEQRREVPGQAGTLHLNAACPLIRRLASRRSPRAEAGGAGGRRLLRPFVLRPDARRLPSRGRPRLLAAVPGTVGVTMSDHWDEYERRVRLFQQAGDRERLELPRLYHEGWACHETDPERSVALCTRGRDEARRLSEPWWELFFESLAVDRAVVPPHGLHTRPTAGGGTDGPH